MCEKSANYIILKIGPAMLEFETSNHVTKVFLYRYNNVFSVTKTSLSFIVHLLVLTVLKLPTI